MKIRDKNPALKKLIMHLGRQKTPFWKAVAKGLNRPGRRGCEVDLFRLEKACQPKEIVVVPGKVLGEGRLSKPLTVAALGFSEKARGQIEQSGGAAVMIRELLEKNPSGKGIRIVG